MDMEALRPILSLMVRHALTTFGGALVADGVMQQADVAGFVGAGMVFAGVIWSWWQKRGQAMVAAELAKLKGAAK